MYEKTIIEKISAVIKSEIKARIKTIDCDEIEKLLSTYLTYIDKDTIEIDQQHTHLFINFTVAKEPYIISITTY